MRESPAQTTWTWRRLTTRKMSATFACPRLLPVWFPLPCSTGSVLDDQGKYPEALEYYNKPLEIKAKVHGQDRPLVASTYNNIGEVYRHQAKYLEALEMYDKSLKIEIKVHSPDHQLGPEHPGTAATQKNIGIVLEKSRQVPGAAQTVQHVPQDPQKKCSAATTRSWPTHTTSKNPADLPFSPSFSILCSTVFMQHRKCAGRPG